MPGRSPLLTQALADRIPRLYTHGPFAGKSEDDATVYACYYHPRSRWTWYVLGADPLSGTDKAIDMPLGDALREGVMHDVIFFGLIHAIGTELGYWQLSELQSVGRIPDNPKIQRVENWLEQPLGQVKAEIAEDEQD